MVETPRKNFRDLKQVESDVSSNEARIKALEDAPLGGSPPHTLDSHSDVTAGAPSIDDALAWDGSVWINDAGFLKDITNENLPDLADVTIAAPADTEVLTYETASSQWKNLPAPAAGPHILDSHTDVSVAGPSTDDVVSWTGASWDNVAGFLKNITGELLGSLSNVSAGAPSTDDVLAWTGATWANVAGYLKNITAEVINSLSDVVITTPLNNEVLTYNTASGDWINQAPAGGGGSSSLGFSGASATVSKGSTDFLGLGTGGVQATEADASYYIPHDATLDNLRVFLSANASNNAGNTVTVRVNSASSVLTVSYGAGVTGLLTDLADPISVSAGDRIDIEVVNTGTGGGTKNIVVETVTFEVS